MTQLTTSMNQSHTGNIFTLDFTFGILYVYCSLTAESGNRTEVWILAGPRENKVSDAP